MLDKIMSITTERPIDMSISDFSAAPRFLSRNFVHFSASEE